MKRKEAWIAAALLTLSLTVPHPAAAQENLTPSGMSKALNELSRILAPPQDSATKPATPMDDPADDEAAPRTGTAPATGVVLDSQRISMVIGQSRTIAFQDVPAKVLSGDSTIVKVMANSHNPTELILTAKGAGVSNITVIDREGDSHRVEVTVTKDATPLQQTLDRMGFGATVQVIPANEGVILRGYVENPQAVDEIIAIARHFYSADVIADLQVVGPQIVQLHVMVAEVSRTKLRALGFNFLRADGNSYFISSVGSLLTPGSVTTSPPSFSFNQANSNLPFGTIGNTHLFRGFLQALKQEGLAKIIAEPTLIAFSGRAASMNIGGEFPIIVPGTQGTFTVEFKEYGNKLDFIPIVLGDGRIRLEVRPELSQLDKANGIIMAGFNIPALTKRYMNTSVELNTGETFVLGGLLSTSDTTTTNKVPYLGDVPVLGAAFRTMSYSKEEKELIVIVTPELVEALKPSQKPCAFPGSESTQPTNRELYWMGNVESPPCTPCETPRRAALGVSDYHFPYGNRSPRSVAVSPPAVAARGTGKGPGTSVPLPVEQSKPSEAQRVSTASGLLGPLGYDAGR